MKKQEFLIMRHRVLFSAIGVVFTMGTFYCTNMSLQPATAPSNAPFALSAVDSTGFVPDQMISIPGGTFQMGCEQDEATPIHSVTLSPFTISNTHVTQGEYMRVMGINPSEFSGSNLLPVESVSWFDAVLYCNKRSKMEQKDTVYSYTAITGTPGNGASNLANISIDYTKNGYRLPTEAEWEYACEAGTTTAYSWGGSYPPKTHADTVAVSSHAAWYLNSNGSTLPEGGRNANAWGLYDMVGNVWSWLNDWNGKYTAGAQTNPTGPVVAGTDRQRIARGSSWSIYDSDYLLRSAIRNGGWHPDDRSSIIGFRVVQAGSVVPTLPEILVPPVSQTVVAGQSAIFSVTASGNPTPSYQWQKNGIAITGAVSNSYSISSVGLNDTGNYSVTVTNTVGSLTSTPAHLSVNSVDAAPVITAQPQSQTATVGQKVTFSVTATGTPAPAFQWQKNGNAIIGATVSTYTISSVQTSDTGRYSVVVNNSQGNVTSNPATLTLASSGTFLPDQMISIPGGTFQMGCEQDEATPIHSVTLSPFTMSNSHVTQGEYRRVMGINPSEFSGSTLLPVESVSWFDAVLYCNKRSRMEQKDTVYSYTAITGTPGNGASNLANISIDYTKNGYRLPTEAEWEYACEAGTTTAYSWGGSYPPKTHADTVAVSSHAAWYLNSNGSTLPEGGRNPNAWGLYDMVGNVWSWLNDWNGKYTAGAQTNPTGPVVAGTDRQRIARGSSWSIYDSDYLLRSAIRNGGWHPEDRSSIIGFRVVRR